MCDSKPATLYVVSGAAILLCIKHDPAYLEFKWEMDTRLWFRSFRRRLSFGPSSLKTLDTIIHILTGNEVTSVRLVGQKQNKKHVVSCLFLYSKWPADNWQTSDKCFFRLKGERRQPLKGKREGKLNICCFFYLAFVRFQAKCFFRLVYGFCCPSLCLLGARSRVSHRLFEMKKKWPAGSSCISCLVSVLE